MRPFRTFIALCVVLGAPASFAQPRPDPADPAVPVPAAEYRSSFAGYRPLGEESVGDWRAANDEVRRIGGWREYARERHRSDAHRVAAAREIGGGGVDQKVRHALSRSGVPAALLVGAALDLRLEAEA